MLNIIILPTFNAGQIHEEHPDNIEALQYLEALCKDLGRAHDEYSKKLEKLRRSQLQNNNNTMAGMWNIFCF